MLEPIDPTEPAPWDLIRVAMVIGPVTGYFHQYYTMYRMKTSIGFSSVTCGVLIVSSIVRIFFWMGDPFDVALLYQSILMTVVQLFLLELCVRYYPWTVQLPTPVTHSVPHSRRTGMSGGGSGGSGGAHGSSGGNHSDNHTGAPRGPASSTTRTAIRSYTTGALSSTTPPSITQLPPLPPSPELDGPAKVTTRASRLNGLGWYREHAIQWGTHFWNWPTIGPYFLFLAVFTLVIGLSLLIIGNTPFYVGLLGLAALGIEATVPLPQAIQNYRSKSTAGFSPAILLMWVVGDSFKTYYYITTHAKYQFIGCGIIQLCIDCVIITQTVIYSKAWKEYRATRRRRNSTNLGGGRYGIFYQPSSPTLQVGGAGGRTSMDALLGSEEEDEDGPGLGPRH